MGGHLKCPDSSTKCASSQGEALSLGHSFFVPPLKVRKDWYEGLNPDPIDHSHPDVGTKTDAQVGEDGQVILPVLQCCMLLFC